MNLKGDMPHSKDENIHQRYIIQTLNIFTETTKTILGPITKPCLLLQKLVK